MWEAALKDKADKRAAGDEEESIFGTLGSPARIASGDVRLVLLLLLLFVVPSLLLVVMMMTRIFNFLYANLSRASFVLAAW